MPRFKNENKNDDGYIISRMNNSKSLTESQGIEKEILIKIKKRNIDNKIELDKSDKKEISTDVNNLSKLNKNDLEIQKSSNNNEELINENIQLNQEKKIDKFQILINSKLNKNDLEIQKSSNNNEEIINENSQLKQEKKIEEFQIMLNSTQNIENTKKEEIKNNIKIIKENKNKDNIDKNIKKEKKEKLKINIDKENDKYPYSLVWTSIPCITHTLPWIGHMGICKSNGIIYDFSGSYLINENKFAFGKPYKYAYLEPNEKEREKWDECIDKIINKFEREEYSFFCNNCHSFCFQILNEIKYNGKCNYGMIGVWWLVVKKGKYLSCNNVFKTYFVFIIIVCAIIGLIVGLKLKK